MVKITNTAAACDRSGVKCVVFGKPKTGKTTLIKTAPAPIIFSSERGLLPLRGEKIPVVEIASYQDLEEAFAWVGSSAEAKNYKTICVDSITDMSDMLLSIERKNNPKKSDAWGPYNRLAENMTDKLREIRNSVGKNWFLICQEEQSKTPEGNILVVPSLPGKALLQEIPYLFDIIARFVKHTDAVTGEVSRALDCHGDNSVMAGDRSGQLDRWEKPHLGNIFAKVLG